MNDIVFAGKYSAFKSSGKDYMRCLKVLSKDERQYAVIPPNCATEAYAKSDEEIVVCIEQPLLPRLKPFTVDGAEHPGMRYAALQALHYHLKGGAVISTLGELIVGYVWEDCGARLHPIVSRLLEDMDKNLPDPTYTVEISMAKLPLNHDYVRRIFKKETGATPHEYLESMRMKRARDIILSGIANSYSNFTVSQIAEACGYAEPLYFSRVFKSHYGVSPLKFAQQNSKR